MLVRQATLDDRSAIFDLIRVAYAGREQYKIPERWQWQFCDNPFWSGPDLPIWIAVDGGRVVGQTGAMIEPIKMDQAATTVAWSVDTYLLPEYRGRGVGRQLQEASQTRHRVFMSLAMSAKNRRIKESLGGRTLRPMQVLELRRRLPADRVAEAARGRVGRLSGVASAVGVDHVLAAVVTQVAQRQWRRRSQEARRSLGGLTVAEITRFDSSPPFSSHLKMWWAITAERPFFSLWRCS
jgi:GNAT superfamily N-acetyltransferase